MQAGRQALAVPPLSLSLFLCSHTLSPLLSARSDAIAKNQNPGGRQVTNLNGARIFRIVQQSDGAAVFPLKIPDAAAHESAQHLLGESLLLCVCRTRTIKLNTTALRVNVTLTTIPHGPLHDQQPRIHPPRRAPLLSR